MNGYSNESSSGKTTKIIIIALAVILVLVGIAGGWYFKPENRLERALNNGYKCLIDEKWDDAVSFFDKAIKLDYDCISAYSGKLQAYIGLDDEDTLEDYYEDTLDIIKKADKDVVKENKKDIVDFYLSAKQVYGEDSDEYLDILEEGFDNTENDDISDELINVSVKKANQLLAKNDYRGAMTELDRALKVDKDDAVVQDCAVKCINAYMDDLFNEHDFDRIRSIADKYQGKVAKADYGDYLSRIAEQEAKEAKIDAFMQKVYDTMATEDYGTMCIIDGSDEANEIVTLFEDSEYVYIPSGSSSGIGTSIIKYADGAYFFYFGEIRDGIKEGYGTAFILSAADTYNVMNGEWKDDAPNGQNTIQTRGERFSGSNGQYNLNESGKMVNGVWDGYVDRKMYWKNYTFDLSFVASMGVPTEDKTAEFNKKFGENAQRIYAYDESPNGYYVWSFRGNENDRLGWNAYTY